MFDVTDLTRIAPVLDSRAVTFENPTGERGAGGRAGGGRKGAPSRVIQGGERVTLADLAGPGTIRHIWMTFPPDRPARMRAVYLEVRYGGLSYPSVSVPCLDFFGSPHGRPVAYSSALTSMPEARGFNSYIPMAFGERIRIDLVNGDPDPIVLYFQIDYTLGESASGRLHVGFRRENPTVAKRDFVVTDGLRGPGRFLGWVGGVRPIDGGQWYGEGEVKVYRDGDRELPTICGTGLEDYVGSAWGMGPHAGLYSGAPLEVSGRGPIPKFVGFYRWHVLDPIMFSTDLRVTLQQIGADRGGLAERVDDYCAAAFTVCERAQPVPEVDVAATVADLE